MIAERDPDQPPQERDLHLAALNSMAGWIRHWMEDIECNLKPTTSSLAQALVKVESAIAVSKYLDGKERSASSIYAPHRVRLMDRLTKQAGELFAAASQEIEAIDAEKEPRS